MLPVRSRGPVDRDMLIPCAREASSIRVHTPVRAGDVIRENFMGTGSDLIASMTLQEGSND
jgi:CxxC motif-containing protein